MLPSKRSLAEIMIFFLMLIKQATPGLENDDRNKKWALLFLCFWKIG